MAIIHKILPFINGGEFGTRDSETNANFHLTTGEKGQTTQTEWSIEPAGKLYYRSRTRTSATDTWGAWGSWINISPEDKVAKAGDTMTGRVQLQQGSIVHWANAGSGSVGYINIAEIKINWAYQNAPFQITFARRGDYTPTSLCIRFNNINNTDPTLGDFTSDGVADAYLYKSAASTWQLYIRKTEAYDNIGILEFYKPYYDNNISVTWKDVYNASLPSGYVAPNSYLHPVVGLATATTVPNLITELRYGNGQMGSVSIGTAYTLSGVTIPTGWYNYLWIPHKTGGQNGGANPNSSDNSNYGALLLMGMTVNSGVFHVRYANSAIANVTKL